MTSELQQTRYDRLVRRVGGIIGPGSKVAEALSELFPVLDVELVPGELLFLGGTILGHGGTKLVGGAATAPRIQLFNPVGSGRIVTCTTVILTTGSTENVRGTVNQTALTTGVGVELSRDGRLEVTSRPTAQIRQDLTAAFTDATIQFSNTADRPFSLTDQNGLAVLPPGSGYEWGNGSVNSTLACSFLWRERTAEDSELSF